MKEHLRSLVRDAGVPFELSDHFYRRMVLSSNAGQGRTGEFLVLASLLELLREERQEAPSAQQVFHTQLGIRRADLYFAEGRFAIEVKSGYVRANRDFRKQVSKDVWLMEHRPDLVAEVLWIFLRGATKPARSYLEAHRIACMDLALEPTN